MIGKKLYPKDNSYAVNLSCSKVDVNLAGSIFDLPKQVEIISEPFNLPIQTTRGIKDYEFVHVRFNGHVYLILNRFWKEDATLNELINDRLKKQAMLDNTYLP